MVALVGFSAVGWIAVASHKLPDNNRLGFTGEL